MPKRVTRGRKVNPQERANVTMSAFEELFGQATSELTLSNGDTVKIQVAKVKHLRKIAEYLSVIASSLPETEFGKIIERISRVQQEKMKGGTSPYLLNTENIVKEVTKDASLLLQLIASLFDVLVPYIEMFTDLSAEQAEELELDDLVSVLLAIVASNYQFFTQRVLPLCLAFMQSQRAMAGSKDPSPKLSETGQEGPQPTPEEQS